MPPRKFKTVSSDLLNTADQSATYFQNRGFNIFVEKFDKGFPYTPTIVCTRQSTTMVVEVFDLIALDRVLTWRIFARGATKDTRVAVCVNQAPSTSEERILRDQGIGLYIDTGNGIIESIPPADLALRVALPELSTLPRKLQRLLGPTYEQFERSHWREGFADACQAVETEARKYLKNGVASGRITFIGKKGTKILTNKQIDKLTMGQLAQTFGEIVNQNKADAVIGQGLADLNKDRVGVIHHKAKALTERRLRPKVDEHMRTIITVCKELVK